MCMDQTKHGLYDVIIQPGFVCLAILIYNLANALVVLSPTAEDGEIEVQISKISPLPTCVSHLSWLQKKLYSMSEVSKNLRLISLDDNMTLDKNLPLQVHVHNSENRPLVVLLAWLMAREKHLMKYASFYLEQRFDVLIVNTTPWQFLWPVKGSQLVAGELLEFLHLNKCYQKMLLHGFSVGGYMWGETLLKIIPEPERYTHVVDRIVGQIWDSAVDISEIPVGVPRAIFQRNLVLQATAEKYIRYHMRTFHNAATQHYIRSSQMFYTNLVRAPALFLLSKTDPIGTEENNKRVWESWESLGVKTYVKCWDKSPHVGHFRKHPKEYVTELATFLDRLGLVAYPEKIEAKLRVTVRAIFSVSAGCQLDHADLDQEAL
uniref:Transmembrane protein 53 n=1 Tax=Timema cristinae TaxID=61476 RepID=A0A7R9CIE7_TIMCR|nr:unnamed protein product [Timema cristinae]